MHLYFCLFKSLALWLTCDKYLLVLEYYSPHFSDKINVKKKLKKNPRKKWNESVCNISYDKIDSSFRISLLTFIWQDDKIDAIVLTEKGIKVYNISCIWSDINVKIFLLVKSCFTSILILNYFYHMLSY